jgi:4-amino-4-deoxy-L-arabinose transferase-like glycosyltransferase
MLNIGAESLWYDESFTAWLAKLSIPKLFEAIKGDVHPPLWYLTEWLNVRLLGSSELALRVPAAILGVLCVLLVWRLALLIGFQRKTAFVAGLLAAVLPGAIYYSQDARMYPMLSFFVLWAAISAIKQKWLWFTVASIGAVYTQNLGVFYVVTIGLAAVLTQARAWRNLIKPALAGGGILLGWLPWLPSLFHQVQQVKAGFWIQPLSAAQAIWPLMSITLGWRLPSSMAIPVYAAAVGITGIGVIAARRWLFTRSGLIVLSVVFGAPALMALVSVVWRSIYLPRATLPSALGLMLLWAYPLNHLSKPNRSVARAIVTPALIMALYSHYIPSNTARFDVPKFIAPMLSQWQPFDVVYYVALDACIISGYYLPNKPYAIMPFATDLNQSLTEESKHAMGFIQTPFDDLKAQGYHRAWVVFTSNALTAAGQLAEMDRIKAAYPYQVENDYETEAASQLIYLVQLQ